LPPDLHLRGRRHFQGSRRLLQCLHGPGRLPGAIHRQRLCKRHAAERLAGRRYRLRHRRRIPRGRGPLDARPPDAEGSGDRQPDAGNARRLRRARGFRRVARPPAGEPTLRPVVGREPGRAGVGLQHRRLDHRLGRLAG
ncbi:hypothetical protein LTR94_033960, partial [Friedmanniomyces endolithicus]